MPDFRPVPVLLYHSISRRDDPWATRPEDFRADMEAVRASGRVPLLATAYARGLRGEEPLPGQAILITFDDGYADFAEHALPVLDRLGLAASLFVTSGWLGTAGMLSADALRDLAGVGQLEIGAHSVRHPHLDIISRHEAATEIRDSRAHLSDLLGRETTAFAYPHGSHRTATKELVRGSGFATAHAVKNALSHTADDPYAVARFTVHAGTSRAAVVRVVAGTGIRPAGRRERLATRVYRPVRRLRRMLQGTA